MDTSETYTKMCEKAVEIQKSRGDTIHLHLDDGDYTYWNGQTVICSKEYNLLLGIFDRVIWLPRQDQLQEMVTEHFKPGLDLCNFYAWYMQTRPNDVSLEVDSMEQLWMAFVMKKKYGKIWIAEEGLWKTK